MHIAEIPQDEGAAMIIDKGRVMASGLNFLVHRLSAESCRPALPGMDIFSLVSPFLCRNRATLMPAIGIDRFNKKR